MAQPAKQFDSTEFAEIEVNLEMANRRLREILGDRSRDRANGPVKRPPAQATATVASTTPESSVAEIRVVDLDIPFTSMLWLFDKAAVAAVPAGIIAWFFWMALSTSLPAIFAALLP